MRIRVTVTCPQCKATATYGWLTQDEKNDGQDTMVHERTCPLGPGTVWSQHLWLDVKTEDDRLKEAREAMAEYVKSEGCDCCANTEAHVKADLRLGKALGVATYSDGSGTDWHGKGY